MSLLNYIKDKIFSSATSLEENTENFQAAETSTTGTGTDEEMETQTTKSQKSVSILEDNHNKDESPRKSPKRPTVNTSCSTTSGTSLKKCSKSTGSTDWRLNLQGVVAKWDYLLENKLFADVTFLVGTSKEHIKCHSLVLKMQSRYFENLFSSDKREFEVSNCSPRVFNKMLKYLYTDKLEITHEDAMEALLLARHFHLTSLQSKCGRLVLDAVNVNNAAGLLKKADDIGDKQLSLKVQEYILQHASEVVFAPNFKDISLNSLQKLLQASRSLWKMPEIRILEAVKKWASAECARQKIENTGPNQYKVAKGALDLIHYKHFTPMQFTTQVVKPKLLPNEKMLEIQSELIEKEESTKVEFTSSSTNISSHEQNENEDNEEYDKVEEILRNQSAPPPPPSAASQSRHSLVIKSDSQEAMTVTDDMDQEAKYDTIHTLNRYSALIAKDWSSDNEDEIYKISINATKAIDIHSLTLYGHANGKTSLVDVFIQVLSFEEKSTYLEFETKTELPENGGEFDINLPRPFHMDKNEWYTLSVVVNGRVHPMGTGGKRSYKVDTSENDNIEFYFKNSKGINGASHVRGQLPKIHFSIPTRLKQDTPSVPVTPVQKPSTPITPISTELNLD